MVEKNYQINQSDQGVCEYFVWFSSACAAKPHKTPEYPPVATYRVKFRYLIRLGVFAETPNRLRRSDS
jgi:hypothetical protein